MGSWGGRNHLMDGIDCSEGSKGSKNCRHSESCRAFFVFSIFFLQNEEHSGTVNHKTWPNGRWVRNNNNYFFFSCFNAINHNLIVRKMFNGTRGGECLFYRWPGWCCWCVSCFVFFFIFFVLRFSSVFRRRLVRRWMSLGQCCGVHGFQSNENCLITINT